MGTPGSDIGIIPLWKEGFTGSRKIMVAVIDTGIDWNHPDLKANIYTNPGEIAGNGLDNTIMVSFRTFTAGTFTTATTTPGT